MTYLFDTCCRAELRVLIQGLDLIDVSKLDGDDAEAVANCLGTLHYQLDLRTK